MIVQLSNQRRILPTRRMIASCFDEISLDTSIHISDQFDRRNGERIRRLIRQLTIMQSMLRHYFLFWAKAAE